MTARPIGSACLTLAHLAKNMDHGAIRNEYVELFIGVGVVRFCLLRLTT